ncbi:toll/interleukin-1 receptor domain-containing protein [Methanobrevibacter sp.]|uniref:toll/interleukin-1 receptor domain-containing protein n=1 Tax=Methanobrevibacter sp. TaxID=66852 RepID=UPI00388EAA86
MSHEVFICYDVDDEDAAEALYHILEENNISSWIKSREMEPDDPVDEITTAIENSDSFVFILSKNSKDTNYVITETDIAFSREIPIIILNIDDTRLKGNLEFILQNPNELNSFPDCKMQLETLVRKISNNRISYPKVDSKYLAAFEKRNPRRRHNVIKKYARIAVPVIIALLFIYFAVIIPTGQMTSDDGVFSMNITHVEVTPSGGDFKYVVYGESYNLPVDKEKYFMNIRFFDKDDTMVYEINSTADEFKSGIICTDYLKSDNVTHIGFRLTDLEDNELKSQDYVMNG